MQDNKKTICLIDDNAQYLEALAYPLAKTNSIHRFTDAKAFLDAITRGLSPDAVITDYRLPEISGTQMAYQLRQIDATIPIVLVTGYLTKEVAVEALNSGISDILEKPLQLESLMLSVEKALIRRRLLLVQKERRDTEKLYVDTLARLSERLESRLIDTENKFLELEQFLLFHEIPDAEEVQRTARLLIDGVKLPLEMKALEKKFETLEVEEVKLRALLLAKQPTQPSAVAAHPQETTAKKDQEE